MVVIVSVDMRWCYTRIYETRSIMWWLKPVKKQNSTFAFHLLFARGPVAGRGKIIFPLIQKMQRLCQPL